MVAKGMKRFHSSLRIIVINEWYGQAVAIISTKKKQKKTAPNRFKRKTEAQNIGEQATFVCSHFV